MGAKAATSEAAAREPVDGPRHDHPVSNGKGAHDVEIPAIYGP